MDHLRDVLIFSYSASVGSFNDSCDMLSFEENLCSESSFVVFDIVCLSVLNVGPVLSGLNF